MMAQNIKEQTETNEAEVQEKKFILKMRNSNIFKQTRQNMFSITVSQVKNLQIYFIVLKLKTFYIFIRLNGLAQVLTKKKKLPLKN